MQEPTQAEYEVAVLNDHYYHGDKVVKVHKLVKQHSQGLLTNEDLLSCLTELVLSGN